MIEINLNQTVKVKLNDKGFSILEEYYGELNASLLLRGGEPLDFTSKLTPDEDGYIEFQLWDFMKIFGQHINFGYEPPFDLNIIVV